MLVEGDATMRVSEDNEGRKTSMLGFVQREPVCPILQHI